MTLLSWLMAKAKEKHPGGRPPERGETSRMVGVRLTDTERAAYEAAAKARGLVKADGTAALSEWIRDVCNRAAARVRR